jgi:hypothetical protein
MKLKLHGEYTIRIRRKNGTIDVFRFKNSIMNECYNTLLNYAFRSVDFNKTWYLGLIDNVGYTAVAITDTLDTHPGWSELIVDGGRKLWLPDATFTGECYWTANVDCAIKGYFLTNGTQLFSAAGTISTTLVAEEQLLVTYRMYY